VADQKTVSRIEQLCIERNMKMTGQRRVIARVLSDAADHPDVEELYRRSVKVDSKISIATVYRTVRLFEEAGLLDRLDFGDGRARYEPSSDDHHDHLIDVKSGKVIEFQEEHVEELQRTVAKKLGYELVGHRMELYGIPLKGSD
jgi:Fur family ferric uptake transcriptional regulator|tara:strand:+ start:196 stop:627 length:432 start_codon:yes stop_codon:yes gene_type:complete